MSQPLAYVLSCLDARDMDPVFATLRSASSMRKPRSGASQSSSEAQLTLEDLYEDEDPVVGPSRDYDLEDYGPPGHHGKN